MHAQTHLSYTPCSAATSIIFYCVSDTYIEAMGAHLSIRNADHYPNTNFHPFTSQQSQGASLPGGRSTFDRSGETGRKASTKSVDPLQGLARLVTRKTEAEDFTGAIWLASSDDSLADLMRLPTLP